MTVAKTVDAELDKSLELDTLAARANEAHQGVEAMGRSTLEYARVAGENLSRAKSLCKHGEWLPWLAANFLGSHKTAWQYITVAESWPEIEANITSGNISTLQGVVEEVKSKPYAQQKIDAFGDKRLSEAFANSDLSKDVALLLGEIKRKGMGLTCVALWEQSHDDAKVRKSEPQLKHLVSQYEAGQTDAQIAVLVERVENGEAKSVFESHHLRQEDRLDENSIRLSKEQAQELAEKAREAETLRQENERLKAQQQPRQPEPKSEPVQPVFAKPQSTSRPKQERVFVDPDDIGSFKQVCQNLIDAVDDYPDDWSSFIKGEFRKSLEQVDLLAEKFLA